MTHIIKSKKLTPSEKKSIYIANRARPSAGFSTFGDYARGIYEAGHNPAIANKLRNAGPTSVSTEATGADAGFLVPPKFAQELGKSIISESLLLYTDRRYTSGSNHFLMPVDRSTPWDNTNGIQVSWEGEADQLAESKPQLGLEDMRLNKLAALVPVSDELVEDSAALQAYLMQKIPEKMAFKIALAIVQGSGVGELLGILNSPALISVDKQSAQSPDTLVPENLVAMVSRLYGPYFLNAIWLASESILPQLLTMSFEGVTSSVPFYTPATGLSTTDGRLTLFGRPLLLTQACEQIGDQGDIILADLSQYLTVMRDEVAEQKISMHMWFDLGLHAYRFVMRIGGQGWLPSAMTPRDGSTTLSSFVCLDERA